MNRKNLIYVCVGAVALVMALCLIAACNTHDDDDHDVHHHTKVTHVHHNKPKGPWTGPKSGSRKPRRH